MTEKLIGLCIAKIKVEEHWQKLKAIHEKALSMGYRLFTYYIDDVDFENRKTDLEPNMFPVISCLMQLPYLEAASGRGYRGAERAGYHCGQGGRSKGSSFRMERQG